MLAGDDFAALRVQLERSRRVGVSFDGAWSRAVDAVALSPSGRLAVEQTRDAWERAYAGEPPTPADHAVVIVATTLDGGLGRQSAPATPQTSGGVAARRQPTPHGHRRPCRRG
jgi:hypothetical protein